MAVALHPYKKGSHSARALKDALVGMGVKTLITHKPPKYPRTLIVNWGNSDFPFNPSPYQVVNPPSVLGLMTNKLRFFNEYGHGDMVPEWTVSHAEASKWEGKVLSRTILEGHSGAGIVITEPQKGDALKEAPLYVKYENKTHEYRLHMARGLSSISEFYPLLIQRKIFQKTEDRPRPVDWAVRNHANGFVYVQNSGEPTPDCVVSLAKDFMNKHFNGLHFCALDVIFHQKKNRAWVLEGNTAPGLEGNTVQVYADYLHTLAKEAKAA